MTASRIAFQDVWQVSLPVGIKADEKGLPGMSEHDEQLIFIQYCNILSKWGWDDANKWLYSKVLPKNKPQTNWAPILQWVFAVPNGGYRNSREASNLKAEGVKSGVADIFVPIANSGFNGMFIEMKFGGGKQSARQVEFEQAVLQQGYCYVVCWSGVSAAEALNKYLGIGPWDQAKNS